MLARMILVAFDSLLLLYSFTSVVSNSVDGELVIKLAPESAKDPAGNLAHGAEPLRGIYVDRTRPVVVLSSPNPRPTNSTIDVVVSFNEFIEDFDLNMVNVSSGDVFRLQKILQSHVKSEYVSQLDCVH